MTHFVFIRDSGFSFICQSVDYSTTDLGLFQAYLSYAYFILKLLDYFDTIFFILRKKSGHVSFLHVYHHVAISICAYICVLFATGKSTVFNLIQLLTSYFIEWKMCVCRTYTCTSIEHNWIKIALELIVWCWKLIFFFSFILFSSFLATHNLWLNENPQLVKALCSAIWIHLFMPSCTHTICYQFGCPASKRANSSSEI